ncbi:ABC transporter ATP-binding protein [Microbacterium sp. NPDC055521]
MNELLPVLRRLFPLLPAGARKFFVVYVLASSALTIFDVIAMAVLALTIAPAVSSSAIDIPLVGTFPVEKAPLLVLVACVLLILKSLFAVVLQFVATRRFAAYEFEVGKRLFDAYIRSSWEDRTRRATAEITRMADVGIANTMSGFVIPLSRVPSNLLTFAALLAVLLLAQPLTAVIALVYLSLIAIFVNRLISRRALLAGDVNRDYTYRVGILMTEVVEALKELTLRDRLGQVADVISRSRAKSVRARANSSFLSTLPQYSFEAALIGGFLLIGGATFFLEGPEAAIASVALFAAAGFRLLPAIVGMQNALVTSTTAIPWAKDVIQDLTDTRVSAGSEHSVSDQATLASTPRGVALRNVSFRYRTSTENVLDSVTLDIPFGSRLAIVGPSGAGKSTLIDILLGLSVPTEGEVLVDGMEMTKVIRAWRSRVGYVPQRVALFDGTIAQNIALTWDDDFDRQKVLEVLDKVQLLPMIQSRPGGIDARIGERGMLLSGGQQQRLGIARALYGDPLVLVLDESTSSLDVETEDAISQELLALSGAVTMISVAHRLSTIKDYDNVCYLDKGRVVAEGSFYELAEKVPAFAAQVRLAGLERTDR